MILIRMFFDFGVEVLEGFQAWFLQSFCTSESWCLLKCLRKTSIYRSLGVGEWHVAELDWWHMSQLDSWLVAMSTMTSVMGNGKSSLGHALFKSWKSTHTQICPFFFLTGIMLAIYSGYCTSWMKPASISLLTSIFIWGISSGRKLLWACLTGHTPFFTAKWCRAILGLSPGISL